MSESTNTSGPVWSWRRFPSARLCGRGALVGLVLMVVGIVVGATANEDATVISVAVVLITGGLLAVCFGVAFWFTAESARLQPSGVFELGRGDSPLGSWT